MEVNGYGQLFVTHILQNIYFLGSKEDETHMGLEQLEDE